MRARVICCALLLCASASVATRTQSAGNSTRVDDFVRVEMKRQRIPGLSLAVVRNGQTVKAEGYGVADRVLKVPATPNTVYKIASVSKLLIAAGVMSLVQEGRIDLDDPIVRVIDEAPASWEAITPRHLLSHTSGLAREGPGFDARRRQSDADVIKSAYAQPLLFAPGEKLEYSNLGYFVLAEMIHRVTGRPWESYLRATIFSPLGMDATRVTSESAGLPNRAVGYQDNDRLLVARDWPALRPSGAFVSSVLDLARWDAALQTSTGLRGDTKRQMWEPVPLKDGTPSPYGLGWRLDTLNGQRMAYHTGSMSGFRAGFARFVDIGLTVIVLMNLDDADMESILRGVARLYLEAGDRQPRLISPTP
jgi:CubicO group peptidase (beta-lactamase class C family)